MRFSTHQEVAALRALNAQGGGGATLVPARTVAATSGPVTIAVGGASAQVRIHPLRASL
jgi:hypothetical protein